MGYGGFHPPGGAAGAVAPRAAAKVGDMEAEGGGEEDEEDEGPKVAPLVTCKLVCCYLLLLSIGVVIGMVANELHWASLKKIHPWLEDLEVWLHKPHNDPEHGGEFCVDGLFLPGPARTGANTLFYLSLLLWAFLGVAIAADVFMAGIEKITSEETTKTVVMPSGEVRRYTITVWNSTIANLTLMALGSSAPEILLSCIEIGSSGFYAGELGPGTIVGSAAFNMLVISAVCVIAIPDGGMRKIKELPVFYITAAFSLAAYVWLIVILQVISPNVVDVWEGMVTLLAFPVLVWVAYRADVADDEPVGPLAENISPEGAAAAEAIGYGKDGRPINRTDVTRVISLKSVEKLSGDEQVKAVASLLLPPQSKAYYRQAATRAALGAAATKEDDAAALRAKMLAAEKPISDKSKPAVVQWAQRTRTCRENEPNCELALLRTGNLSSVVTVNYASASGTATEGVDFEAARGTVVFKEFQESAIVNVRIIDDEEEEDDETFTVSIFGPSAGCEVGPINVCEVTIEDDDGPGELHFASHDLEVFENVGTAMITVRRTHGCEGTVGCFWQTRDGTAKENDGYEPGSGFLEFGHGVTQQSISVPVIDHGTYHRDEDFQIVLSAATGGARFVTDSATRTRRATTSVSVTIHSDEDRKRKVDEMIEMLDFSQGQALAVQSESGADLGTEWQGQFSEAVDVPEDGSSLSLVLFALAIPWKLVGASVPPPGYFGGWACFLVALVFIGLLTALIGDLASHMGCCMGLKDSVTAITFVALGTSLPDTFASRSAAASEPYADASIVNITGSNSVNVFLGLGLPWAAAAIYWALHGDEQEVAWRKRYQNEPWYSPTMPVGFAVPAGDLGYSVSVFCACSTVCLSVLVLRRSALGGELGGPPLTKWLSFLLFVGLWFVYIYLSVQHSNKH